MSDLDDKLKKTIDAFLEADARASSSAAGHKAKIAELVRDLEGLEALKAEKEALHARAQAGEADKSDWANDQAALEQVSWWCYVCRHPGAAADFAAHQGAPS